ncbi:hypothetical protein [Streptomyces sp. NPDC058664]|uniref:hypothetical protein n=1 Tax=unclassified Streptomyces TaxID=2593676 RepID=UPI00365547D9
MSSEQPHQGGYGGQPGYGAPGAPGGYGAPAQPAPVRPASHRGAWIGAGATLLAAVIGVVGTYVVTSNSKPTPPAAQGPAPSVTTAGTPGGEAAPPDASQSPDTSQSRSPESQAPRTAPTPPAKPAGTVEWQGALAITYTDSKDLDSAPPVDSEIREENDFSVYPFGSHMLRPEGGAKALVWKDSTKTPAYEDCAGVVDTLGTDADMKLKTGLVVCARTNDGRLARLTVKELTGQSSDTAGVFDVVVWSG